VTTAHGAARVGPALRVLLADAIDYAGLFPPAQLDMPGAVAEYAAYVGSADSWALGRFVVPAARLDELAAAGAQIVDATPSLGAAAWRLSALLGPSVQSDIAAVHAFNAAQAVVGDAWTGTVDCVEVRASAPDQIAAIVHNVGRSIECFVEIPISSDPVPLIRAIAAAGARAKVRTGGTTPDAFPTSDDLVRFLAACVSERVSFKATAGLHHPLRGEYALTYAAGSERGTMYGFLNVFLAAALLQRGGSTAAARDLIEERSPDAVQMREDGVTWHGIELTSAQLADTRRLAMMSFGSCSFREPLDDLTTLGML
jgi:hypothetical protein